MNILALDTATTACSVAVLAGDRLAAARSAAMPRGHAEALLPMVEAAMAEAGLAYDALGAVAVTVGPGAFTGLRVGLAAARGLALALSVPAVGITTLRAFAAAAPEDGLPVLAAVESRRDDVFVQLFAPDRRPLGEPRAVAPAAVAALLPAGPVRLVGDAAARLLPLLAGSGALPSDAPEVPQAELVARLAAADLAAGIAAPAAPLYLRPPDVTLPAPRG
ncbi:MAG TPA: tRNA (adenosine(37)-N6)-threonylcarbamoyltransferase complex dimerization subunit type 1 TsaB [Alphaproteobacteria bacterium]|nr:tRNA (adenosine(37)-N6)-threonylcarbamoyltransferase complex dimerization subunit type 1 TsaB [Alphaproteobacteria bacterium]